MEGGPITNIYGPGLTGDQATASRTPQLATGSGADLWFKDCSSEEAQDGTRIRAQWLNFIMANLREAIRGMGVSENETDDDMLLKCFQKLQTTNWLNLPIFPEILQTGNVLSMTEASGVLTVDANQFFLHRGWNKVNTNDYSVAQRQLPHLANKTYHARWQYNGGSPIFVLKDVADAVYNPTAAAETNAAFDSTYDDMLFAKVVTNGSNVPTITQLKNKALLSGDQYQQWYPMPISNDTYGARGVFSFTYNWARTPNYVHSFRQWCQDSNGTSPNDYAISGGVFNMVYAGVTPVSTRYLSSGNMTVAWAGAGTVSVHARV